MIVRVTCPRCGDVAVPIAEVWVQQDPTVGDVFRFVCEGCGHAVHKRAVGRVAEMLLTAGAQREPQVAPLSLVDLAALRADLERDDWLERLLA